MTDGDLAAKVANWLATTGLPFEMRTARTFRSVGLDVIQSSYYNDPETSTSREIDLIAYRRAGVNANVVAAANIVAECKVTTSKPWVMFADVAKPAEAQFCKERVTTTAGKVWLNEVQFIEQVRQLPLLLLGPRPSYALATANLGKPEEKGKDLAYAAVMGATKAARALADALEAETKDRTYGIVFPAVILRGQLFLAWLDSDGKLEVQETDRGQLMWRNPAGGGELVVVDVVTERALEQFAVDAFATADALVTGTSEQIHRAEANNREVY